MTPKVTVLMPVYNGEEFLREAMESVLAQTFADFEFLVIDDGSSDASASIVNSYQDGRIRLIANGKNLGLVKSLNRGIGLARGRYIARMDCDDVCQPRRLEVQVAFMEAHPEVGVCGSWVGCIGSPKIFRMPVTHSEITVNLLLNSAFAHPSVVIRRSLLAANNLQYSDAYAHAEDYALWVQAASLCSLANIPEVLLLYRVHGDQVSQSHCHLQMESASRIRSWQLERMGVRLSEEEKSKLDEIGSGRPAVTRPFLATTSSLFQKIIRGNVYSKRLDHGHLRKLFSRLWLDLCLRCQQPDLWLIFAFFHSWMRFRFPVLQGGNPYRDHRDY